MILYSYVVKYKHHTATRIISPASNLRHDGISFSTVSGCMHKPPCVAETTVKILKIGTPEIITIIVLQ